MGTLVAPRGARSDPVSQWPSYSGLLATKGGLSFWGSRQGTCLRWIRPRDTNYGAFFSEASTYAPPITFTMDGRQVIVVSAGQALFMFGLREAVVFVIAEGDLPHAAVIPGADPAGGRRGSP